MAKYVVEQSENRGGWCVFEKKGLLLEYKYGPFLHQSALDQARALNGFGGKPDYSKVNSRHECLNCRGCGCAECEPGTEKYGKSPAFNHEDLPPGPVKKREGFKYIKALPDSEPCVGMLMFKDTMYVATGKGVYKMVGDKLEAVHFLVKEDQ